ncbi:hypothetical protein INR49_001314, partial [Caranx melampygus]
MDSSLCEYTCRYRSFTHGCVSHELSKYSVLRDGTVTMKGEHVCDTVSLFPAVSCGKKCRGLDARVVKISDVRCCAQSNVGGGGGGGGGRAGGGVLRDVSLQTISAHKEVLPQTYVTRQSELLSSKAVDLGERRRHVGGRAEEVGVGERACELHSLLVPVSPQNALHLRRKTKTHKKKMGEGWQRGPEVDLGCPVLVGLVGDQDELDAQGDEDEGGSHGPHVEAGLGLVRHPQLGDENPNDVEQEKKRCKSNNNTLRIQESVLWRNSPE